MIMTMMLLVSVIMVMIVVGLMMTTLPGSFRPLSVSFLFRTSGNVNITVKMARLWSVVIEMRTIPTKMIMVHNFENHCEILLQIIKIKMLSMPNISWILNSHHCAEQDIARFVVQVTL